MLTPEEAKKLLLDNFIDENGNLHIDDIDLSDFDGDVYIDKWKIKNSLSQSNHNVGKSLWQDGQRVGRYLFQDFQRTGIGIIQGCQITDGFIYQTGQLAEHVYQDNQPTEETNKPKNKLETKETSRMIFKETHKTKDGLFYVELPDLSTIMRLGEREGWVSKNITNIRIRVYNTRTNSFSEKSLYMDKDNKLYFKGKIEYKQKKYYIDELIEINKEK